MFVMSIMSSIVASLVLLGEKNRLGETAPGYEVGIASIIRLAIAVVSSTSRAAEAKSLSDMPNSGLR